jgi:hypothetical protein
MTEKESDRRNKMTAEGNYWKKENDGRAKLMQEGK